MSDVEDESPVLETICYHDTAAGLPTVLKFQNGSLGGISNDTCDYSVVESKKDKRKRPLVTAGENIYTGEFQSNEQFDMYLCVRDKSTNKLTVMSLQESLMSNNIYQQLEKKKQLPKLTKEHATKKLLKEFGGRKASRFVANSEQMMVNVDVVRGDLDKTVQGSAISEVDDGILDPKADNAELLATIVPKCDKTATTVSEVYDVEDVVPRSLLDRLDEESKVVFSTPLDDLPIESEYLRDCLKSIKTKEIASKQDFRNIKLIIYMDALQSLIALRSRQMKFVELSRITEKVENDIRNRFADPNTVKSCTRTNFSSEKALTHFIVLALLISEKYEVDVNVLSRALRISKQRILTYAHIVNARPKARTDLLTLRLPSAMPPLPTGTRFQRKK